MSIRINIGNLRYADVEEIASAFGENKNIYIRKAGENVVFEVEKESGVSSKYAEELEPIEYISARKTREGE